MACFSSTVPLTGVYLVKFCRSASIAAFLMLSGVGKSGSPALKSTTSTPSRRCRSASAATFMVEDSLIQEIRSASSCTIGILYSCFSYCNSLFQPLFHGRRHHAAHVPSQRSHFLHQVRADEGVLLTRHQEDRLDLRPQPPVHERHLPFQLIVGDGPHSAHDHGRSARSRVVHQQPIERRDLPVRVRL